MAAQIITEECKWYQFVRIVRFLKKYRHLTDYQILEDVMYLFAYYKMDRRPLLKLTILL